MATHQIFGNTNLYNTFSFLAHWTWRKRATAKRAGFPFSEETITETILLDIATANPFEIQILPFNKRQEGRIGADWEWLFFNGDKTKFFRTLVQAKVLDDTDTEYSHIDRKIGNTGVRQIDRLIQTAQTRGIPALYAFYNHLNVPTRVPIKRCPCHGCLECWGCSVALADAVRCNLPNKDFDALKKVSMPWICMFCNPRHPLPPVESAPEKAAEGFQRLFNLSAEERVEDFVGRRTPTVEELLQAEPPDYFELAQEIRQAESPQLREEIVGQIEAENPDIDGVILLTDGNEG